MRFQRVNSVVITTSFSQTTFFVQRSSVIARMSKKDIYPATTVYKFKNVKQKCAFCLRSKGKNIWRFQIKPFINLALSPAVCDMKEELRYKLAESGVLLSYHTRLKNVLSGNTDKKLELLR